MKSLANKGNTIDYAKSIPNQKYKPASHKQSLDLKVFKLCRIVLPAIVESSVQNIFTPD